MVTPCHSPMEETTKEPEKQNQLKNSTAGKNPKLEEESLGENSNDKWKEMHLMSPDDDVSQKQNAFFKSAQK
jgi:hypothetical protein